MIPLVTALGAFAPPAASGEPPQAEASTQAGASSDAPRSRTSAPSPGLSRRRKAPLIVLGEFGWNSLTGVGMLAGYHLHDHLTLEGGAGFSPVKWKFGVRARANLLTGEWAPFVSAGFAYGLGDPDTEALWLGGGAAFRYHLLRSPSVQLSAGLDFTGEDGVVFLANLGWSFLLTENVQISRGTPTDQQRQLMDLAFKSGPAISLAFGYAF